MADPSGASQREQALIELLAALLDAGVIRGEWAVKVRKAIGKELAGLERAAGTVGPLGGAS
jgi:hypothetical protein